MWLMLAAFLITAVGASLVLIFLFEPEPRQSALNGWVILGIVIAAAAIALGLLHGRWFSRVPEDAAIGVTVGMFLRVAIIELVWIVTFLFFILGVADGSALLASIAAAVALTLVFAAPTARLVSHLQDQLDTPHLAPLATAVRQALQAAIESGALDDGLLRRRVQEAAMDADPTDPSDLQALMRAVVQVRRGHGYLLQLKAEDVDVQHL